MVLAHNRRIAMRNRISILSLCMLFSLPALAEQTATLCFTDLASPPEMAIDSQDNIYVTWMDLQGDPLSVTQVGGNLVFEIEEIIDICVTMTADIGAQMGLSEELILEFTLEEDEHGDVTIHIPEVTDHAHIDPSFLPEKVLVSVGFIDKWVPDALIPVEFGCASPLKIGVTVSEEVGIAPWEDIEVTLTADE